MDEREIPGMAATSNPGDFDILDAIKNTPEGEKWKCPCYGRPMPCQPEGNGKLPDSNAEQVLE